MKSEWTLSQKLALLFGSIGIVVFVFLGIKYIFPIVSPFVIAYLIALAIEKPVNWLAKRLGGRTVLSSTVIVILLTAAVASAAAYLACLGIAEIKSFIQHFDYYMIVVRQTTARICFNMDGWLGIADGECLAFVDACVEHCTQAFSEMAGSDVMGRVVSVSLPFVVKAVTVIGSIIVSLMSVVYLSKQLDNIRKWRQETVFFKEVEAVTDSLKRLMGVYFKVQAVIMAINAALCVAGLMIIRNPYAVVIGILIGIVDALPIFGTGTVLIPWAVIRLVMGDFLSAAVLMTVYVVTYFVREIMESKCMGNRLGIAPFTMLVVIFTGLMVYGIMGFILGPVSYCIMKALILYLKTVIERGKLGNT